MFGRCKECGLLRWITPTYMTRYGIECPRCGSQLVQHARVRFFERFKLLYWYLWEHAQTEHSRWWLNPVDVARGVYHGLRVR